MRAPRRHRGRTAGRTRTTVARSVGLQLEGEEKQILGRSSLRKLSVRRAAAAVASWHLARITTRSIDRDHHRPFHKFHSIALQQLSLDRQPTEPP